MNRLRTVAGAALLFTAILLSSCIDGHEEIWINPDGSGRAKISLSLPASTARRQGGDEGIREMIQAFADRTPQITLSDYRVVTGDDITEIKIDARFESAFDLMELSSQESLEELPSAASHLVGKFETELSGRTIEYSREIELSKAIPGASFLPKSQLNGHRMVYIFHLPAPAKSTNATRIDDKRQTLVWDVPLADAIRTPITTRFSMDIPIPWKTLSAVTIPLALIGGFAFFRFRKLRKEPRLPNS